jgi:hypothetical protein
VAKPITDMEAFSLITRLSFVICVVTGLLYAATDILKHRGAYFFFLALCIYWLSTVIDFTSSVSLTGWTSTLERLKNQPFLFSSLFGLSCALLCGVFYTQKQYNFGKLFFVGFGFFFLLDIFMTGTPLFIFCGIVFFVWILRSS